MFLINRRSTLCAIYLTTVFGLAANGMTVTLIPSVTSPAPLGTLVTFSASTDASTANLWYRFSVRRQGGDYQVIRDYSPINTLNWTAADQDGSYEVQVSARDLDTGDESTIASHVHFQSLLTGQSPVISPTANPLVFLYSAPACVSGSRMRVQFQASGATTQNTPYKACTPGSSMNFYLAGLLASTTYNVQHTVDTGSAFVPGPAASFTTGSVPAGLYTDTILVPSTNPTSDPILLGGPLGDSMVANDLSGNVLWYAPPGITFLTHPEAGGQFWGIIETDGVDSSQQIVRKFDLAGMTLLETNAARVSEQLTALGKRTITGFHHEAVTLPDGNIAVLGSVEQIMSDVQGPGPIDILGDMIVVMDKNLNVIWAWDTFDNLDVTRKAILGETCPTAGCPPFFLASVANDWTHGNALQQTADGNMLYSTRNQDWAIKISYANGTGDGHIIWRMGIDGDFQIDSKDSFPWFSHQHDPNFQKGDPTRLLVFDDGNTRVATQGGNSRGQVFTVDEKTRTVTPVLNADLGLYAAAVGYAEHLLDGNYHFDVGFVQENNTIDSYSLEVDLNGKVQYEAHQSTALYRTFRMTDMYTPQ